MKSKRLRNGFHIYKSSWWTPTMVRTLKIFTKHGFKTIGRPIGGLSAGFACSNLIGSIINQSLPYFSRTKRK